MLSHSFVSDSLQPHGLQPARILSPWNFPGKNTGVGWVAISSSRESFQPRDWTWVSWVSCISRWILYPWTTWETQERIYKRVNIKHLKNLWLCAYFTCWILMLNNYLILCCKRKRNDQFYSWFCCVLACMDIRDIYVYIHILCVYTQVYYTCIYTIYLYILYVYVYAHTLDLYSFMLLFYLIYKLAF